MANTLPTHGKYIANTWQKQSNKLLFICSVTLKTVSVTKNTTCQSQDHRCDEIDVKLVRPIQIEYRKADRPPPHSLYRGDKSKDITAFTLKDCIQVRVGMVTFFTDQVREKNMIS